MDQGLTPVDALPRSDYTYYTYVGHGMTRVSSAEFQRRIGAFTEMAQREPVIVTKHDRESVVLVSAVEFARLLALDTRQSMHVWELPDDLATALDAAEPSPAGRAFDDEVTD